MAPCEELLEYLVNLGRIYRGTSTHRLIFEPIITDTHLLRCIFPVLQPLSQSLLFRLVLVTKDVQEAVLGHWVSDSLAAQAKTAVLHRSIEELTLLGLMDDKNRLFSISPAAKAALTAVLFAPTDPPQAMDVELPSSAEESEVFEAIWTEILQKTLDGAAQHRHVETAVERLLFGERLRFGRESPASFRFVLSPRRAQIWRLVVEQLQVVETQHGASELVQALALLGCVLQQGRLAEADEQRAGALASGFGQFLGALGLRTRLGVRVMRGEVTAGSSVMTGAQMVTDSNLHILAYTTSALQLRILGLFAEVRRSLGSATAAVVTRASVWRASDAGVSAEKIVEFLQASAGVVPENVITQLKLWEQDAISTRLKFTDAVLVTYDKVATEAATREFFGLKEYAAATGCLLGVKELGDKRCVVLDKAKALALGILAI